jgi:dynein heavy chain
VRNFPLNDLTQVFGLHSNAEITSALLETSNVCEVVLSLLPRTAGAGASPEEIIKGKLETILKKLPAPFDVASAASRHPVLYE